MQLFAFRLEMYWYLLAFLDSFVLFIILNLNVSFHYTK